MSERIFALIGYLSVPILTQSENWALFAALAFRVTYKSVPILTQSENWALYYKFSCSHL